MPGAKVELELVAEVDKARRELEKFTSQTQKQLNSINFTSAITAINAGFELASKAARYAGQAFEATVGEAIRFEVVTQRLAQSLKNAGDFTQEATDELIAYADSLEAATGVQDDLIISALSLSKSYGLSNDEAKKATAAALELAAATGTSLDSAISQVAGTVSGKYSKELVKLVPELKTLTKEQLIAGEAFKLIQQRLNGAALAAGSTTQGEFNKLKNEIADFGKSLGVGFLGPINLAIQEIQKLFNVITNFRQLVKEEIDLGRLFKVQAGIGSSGIGNLQAAEGARAAEDARRAAEEKALEDTRIRAEKEKEFREKATQEYEAIRADLAKNGYTALEKLEIEFAEKRKVIDNARQAGLLQSESDRLRLVANLEKEYAQQSLELREKNNQKIAQNAAEELTKAFIQARALSDEEVASAGLGIAAKGLKGKAGAGDVIASAGGAVVNAFLPGAGAIVKEILSVFAEGPDAVKQLLDDFISSIPRVLTNIITSIPQVILSILREIPKALIEFIKNGIPEIIDAFITNIPIIIQEFIKYIPQLIIGLVKALIEAIPKIIKSFINALVSQAKDFINALIDAFKNVGGLFGGSGGSGGGGGGFSIGSILDPLGFFLTRQAQQFQNDQSTAPDQPVAARDREPSLLQPIIFQMDRREISRVMLDLSQRGYRTT